MNIFHQTKNIEETERWSFNQLKIKRKERKQKKKEKTDKNQSFLYYSHFSIQYLIEINFNY